MLILKLMHFVEWCQFNTVLVYAVHF